MTLLTFNQRVQDSSSCGRTKTSRSDVRFFYFVRKVLFLSQIAKKSRNRLLTQGSMTFCDMILVNDSGQSALYIAALMAAIAPSDTAVATWRTCLTRMSPAA